ncbi:MAG: S-layer homology domain-containing protein [bacterium]
MKRTVPFLCLLLAAVLVFGAIAGPGVSVEAAKTYSDVPEDAAYAAAIQRVSNLGLMGGIGGGSFGPALPMSRAMFVTVLHRLAGTPRFQPANFSDVPANAWYATAVGWGTENGIVKGYGGGLFGPDDPVSRQQMAGFLYRFCTYAGFNTSASFDLDTLPNAGKIFPSLAEAVSWAVAVGILEPDGEGCLNGDAPADRATAAQVFAATVDWLQSPESKLKPDIVPEPKPIPVVPAPYIPPAPEPTPQELQFPVTLSDDGTEVTYGFEGEEQTITLDAKNLYLDGRLSEEEAAKSEFVFTTFNEAVTHLTDGTAEEPMNLWIAPYVYWIHDPAAESTDLAYQLTFGAKNLHITGLTDDPMNVVVAANFGHDEGYAGGNPTMFRVSGDGLELRNMTFGNYCNIDLEYPLDPSLNVPKRTTNVTQAQIASYSGDKLYAENVRFVSRLNMMPFNNSGRALYVNCHLESTADSLNSSSRAVYLGCDFEFYSSKAWGGSSGVTLLDCTMKIVHQFTSQEVESLTHYMVKFAGRFTVVDSEFIHSYPRADVKIGWCDVLSNTYRSYFSNVTMKGKPVTFDEGGLMPDASVDMTGTDMLRAYKLTTEGGETVYNVYNLLRGTDGWDPLGQKELVESLGAADLPTDMSARVASGSSTLETGVNSATLSCSLSGPQRTDYTSAAEVTWSVKPEFAELVKLTPSDDGKTCVVEGNNYGEEAVTVVVTAKDKSGLEGAVSLTVRPGILPAPTFTEEPAIAVADSAASLTYALDLGERADMSRITWSLCDDETGANAVEIAVGRGSEPLKSLPLYKSYAGKVLRAVIEPKHIRSDYGTAVTVYSAPLEAEGLAALPDTLDFNITTFSTRAQPNPLPALWAVDIFKPADTNTGAAFGANWVAGSGSGIGYGTGGKDGVKDYTGIYYTARGARLRFTPEAATTGDMSFTMKVAPGKTAAQGFGSANQYLDVIIKYDAAANTGYGLRIYRLTSSSCNFALVEYGADGASALLTEPVESRVFLTECTIAVSLTGNQLAAHVETTHADHPGEAVDLTAEVTPNLSGGVCLQHTGTVGDNTIYIGSMTLTRSEAAELE